LSEIQIGWLGTSNSYNADSLENPIVKKNFNFEVFFEDNKSVLLYLQEHKLVLEHNMFDINGFFTGRRETFYQISDQYAELRLTSGNDLIGEFVLSVHPDIISSKRSVVTYFDWLGTVGGL
jgi:hypothetical protein